MKPHELLESEFLEGIHYPYDEEAYPVACSSGTAALHLSLEALFLPKGSQVLVPEFSMIAVARAVSLAGLCPVFVDCDDDFQMSFEDAQNKVTPRTSAILLVHVYGKRTEYLEKFKGLAREKELAVIEDCAEYHGGDLKSSEPSDAYTWSFYRNKIVSGEEGGMVVFKDQDPAMLATSLRCQGFTEEHDFLHVPFGHNYRLADSQAELIRSSLRNMNDEILERRSIVQDYRDRIAFKDPSMRYISLMRSHAGVIPWVFPVQVVLPEGTVIEDIVQTLNLRGVEARCGFKPMSQQIEYIGHFQHLNAFRLSRETLYFPLDILKSDPNREVDILLSELHRSLPAPRTAHG